MLVLTRFVNESIVIGPDVTVTILGVQAGKVRLGVAAPTTVTVNRMEVSERIAADHPGRPVPSLSRHRDTETAYRNALHLVVSRVGTWGEEGGRATFTASELRQIERALAGKTGVRP